VKSLPAAFLTLQHAQGSTGQQHAQAANAALQPHPLPTAPSGLATLGARRGTARGAPAAPRDGAGGTAWPLRVRGADGPRGGAPSAVGLGLWRELDAATPARPCRGQRRAWRRTLEPASAHSALTARDASRGRRSAARSRSCAASSVLGNSADQVESVKSGKAPPPRRTGRGLSTRPSRRPHSAGRVSVARTAPPEPDIRLSALSADRYDREEGPSPRPLRDSSSPRP
jgi:hypothetical protein